MNPPICPVCNSNKNLQSFIVGYSHIDYSELVNYSCKNHFYLYHNKTYYFIYLGKYKILGDHDGFTISEFPLFWDVLTISNPPKINLNDPNCFIDFYSKIPIYLSFQ